MPGQFVFTCQVQPASGDVCPVGEGEWISSSFWQYGELRDMLFQAPAVEDVAVIMGVAISIGIAFALPRAVGRIFNSGMIGAGILSRH